MKAVVVLLLVALAFAQPILIDSSCEYLEASLPDNLNIWEDFRRFTCGNIDNADDCYDQGYCWWRDTTNQNELSTHQQIFVPPKVYNPATGVYVAVGYDLGNSILVINNNQAVLIDTVGSLASGQAVKAAFEEAIGGPIPTIVAVVYTHSHPDHFGGTLAFTIPAGTPIITAANFLLGLQKSVTTQTILTQRSAKQFGFILGAPDADGFLGCGIGPKVFYDTTPKLTPPIVNPNAINPLAPVTTRTLAGLTFEFYFTAGETDDTISIRIPSLNIVAVGDNFYVGFPNLYAIRGTPPRDARAWYTSVDRVRDFNAGILIGSHGPPLIGAATIYATLDTYGNAIQYVHDQTVALINQGLFPDDIANAISLPADLAEIQYLKEFYGYIPWCVKSIFTFYLGWFSGNIAELDLPNTTVQASRLVDLAGGPQIAIIKAVASLDEGTTDGAQWALQLADAVLRSSAPTEYYYSYAQDIFIEAAQILGYNQPSSNGRNYYLSTVEGIIASRDPAAAAVLAEQRRQYTVQGHMAAVPSLFMDAVVPTKINTAKSANIILPVKVLLKDVDLEYSISVRRYVAEVYPVSHPVTHFYDYAFEMTFATANSFKSVFLGLSTVEDEINNQNLTANASIEEIQFFFDLFQ